ncbi:hypothetical protein SVR5_02240 [Glaesserella parasuis 29755]|nr:hypothetical protein SVR5_02240 [Glaesserella parasuis 29755]
MSDAAIVLLGYFCLSGWLAYLAFRAFGFDDDKKK